MGTISTTTNRVVLTISQAAISVCEKGQAGRLAMRMNKTLGKVETNTVNQVAISACEKGQAGRTLARRLAKGLHSTMTKNSLTTST